MQVVNVAPPYLNGKIQTAPENGPPVVTHWLDELEKSEPDDPEALESEESPESVPEESEESH